MNNFQIETPGFSNDIYTVSWGGQVRSLTRPDKIINWTLTETDDGRYFIDDQEVNILFVHQDVAVDSSVR
jgi:hypothetical protein